MNAQARNEELIEAVTHHRVSEVKQLLELGADPNYERAPDPLYPDREHQPWSPLRMVVFCISDNLLKEKDLVEFQEVARLLIKHGAETAPAMKLAEKRYGKYSPAGGRSEFLKVWDIIAVADQHSGA